MDSRNTSANTIQAPYWWINSFMAERQSGGSSACQGQDPSGNDQMFDVGDRAGVRASKARLCFTCSPSRSLNQIDSEVKKPLMLLKALIAVAIFAGTSTMESQ
jgi:hypothetical protein